MGYASALVESYFRRVGYPSDSAIDGVWQFEHAVLRDMLSRLEVILDDEDVDRPTAERIIRCLLYGSPSPAVAELRERETKRTIELMQRLPPTPVFFPGPGP
jgi:Mn-dependent DtxR family transcriptional regulator